MLYAVLNAKNSMLRAHRGKANLLMIGWFNG